MPMKLPNGTELPVSTSMMALIPGFESMASSMMKKTMLNKGIAGIDELRELCVEADVKMVGCQMTADLFDYGKDEFMPEVNDWVGAASFLPIALKSDVNFFM